MSAFNRVVTKVRDTATKVGEKVVSIGDSAAASVRAKRLEMKIDEQYENLGRIVYRDLHTEEDLEQAKLEVIATIDALFDELESIKAAKAAKAEETEEAEQAQPEVEEACACECECECEAQAQAPVASDEESEA